MSPFVSSSGLSPGSREAKVATWWKWTKWPLAMAMPWWQNYHHHHNRRAFIQWWLPALTFLTFNLQN